MHLSPETLGGQFCLSFNDSGSFSSLCSLYSVPLSLSSALSGPLVSTGIYLYKHLYISILEEGHPYLQRLGFFVSLREDLLDLLARSII